MTDFYVQKGHAGTDSGTETNPFLTIDQGFNAITTAGVGPHNVYIKTPVTGSYTELATVDTIGTVAAPVHVVGYDVSITEDPPVQIVIDGSGSNNYGIATSLNDDLVYQFRNIRVTASTGSGFSLPVADQVSFVNCTSDNNSGDGIEVDNNCSYFQCSTFANGGDGINSDSNNMAHSCKSYANTGNGITSNNITAVNCLFYGMAGTGETYITSAVANLQAMIANCTFDGEGAVSGVGAFISSGASPSIIVNNVFYDLGTAVESTNFGANVAGYNLMNSNTTDYDSLTPLSGTDVSGAPQFTNEAGDDYSLASGSPAVDAGTDASSAP